MPIPSHSMWKDRAILKLSRCESTFSVNRSRVTWCVFFLTNRSRRQNLNENKFSLSTYTYTFEYTKRSGAQLCIRWYIDPYRWHEQFKASLPFQCFLSFERYYLLIVLPFVILLFVILPFVLNHVSNNLLHPKSKKQVLLTRIFEHWQ